MVSHRAAYVDVRDLARAHVLALMVPEAGRNRIIVHAGPYVGQKFGERSKLVPDGLMLTGLLVDAARRVTDRIPAKDAFSELQVPITLYDAQKSAKLLGVRYRSLEETAEDTIHDLQVRGWMP